jgi:antitoxin component YwqK of YwqJK toxin-antitoxin module
MKLIKILLIISLLFEGCISVYGQEPSKKKQIKSLIVLEERGDMLIKKPLKESETYYDQKGNILEVIEYKNGKFVTHFKFMYNDNGDKIREEDYDSTGKLQEYSEYKYEKGLRVEKLVYDPNNKIKLRKIYQYTVY